MLFQIYALLFAASTYAMIALAGVFDPDVAPGTDGAVTNTPSITYYVIVFITGLIFLGFRVRAAHGVTRLPQGAIGHVVRRAVLFSSRD